MGGQPSRTRKLTVENDEPINVIKVSDDCVQRLKKGAKEASSASSASSGVSNNVNPGPSWPAATGNDPAGVPVPYPYYAPSLTTVQLQQEKQAALKSNDEYWERRLCELERSHEQMHDIMECEYKKAMEEVLGQASTGKPAFTSVPCEKKKKQVMECYKKHPKEPMRCAKEVQAFSECVDQERATVMTNRA